MTTLVEVKPDPLIVSVNVPEFAMAEDGDKLVIAGMELVTEKFAVAVPPPPGFVTVTATAPTDWISELGTFTVRAVAVWDAGVRLSLPKVTVLLDVKFVPLIVSGNPPELTTADGGDKLEIVGAVPPVTVKLLEVVPPPGAGLVTVTVTVPDVCKSAFGTVTVIADEVIELGVKVSLPKATVLDELKPEPLIVNVKSPEFAAADDGDRLVIVGTGLLIYSVAGLETVICAVPAETISFAGIPAVN